MEKNNKFQQKLSTENNAIGIAQNFSSYLHNQIAQLNEEQKHVEATTMQFMLGDEIEPHEVMLAAQKAMIGVELTVQVRNKVVEAYQEVMRMQI